MAMVFLKSDQTSILYNLLSCWPARCFSHGSELQDFGSNFARRSKSRLLKLDSHMETQGHAARNGPQWPPVMNTLLSAAKSLFSQPSRVSCPDHVCVTEIRLVFAWCRTGFDDFRLVDMCFFGSHVLKKNVRLFLHLAMFKAFRAWHQDRVYVAWRCSGGSAQSMFLFDGTRKPSQPVRCCMKMFRA